MKEIRDLKKNMSPNLKMNADAVIEDIQNVKKDQKGNTFNLKLLNFIAILCKGFSICAKQSLHVIIFSNSYKLIAWTKNVNKYL